MTEQLTPHSVINVRTRPCDCFIWMCDGYLSQHPARAMIPWMVWPEEVQNTRPVLFFPQKTLPWQRGYCFCSRTYRTPACIPKRVCRMPPRISPGSLTCMVCMCAQPYVPILTATPNPGTAPAGTPVSIAGVATTPNNGPAPTGAVTLTVRPSSAASRCSTRSVNTTDCRSRV